MKSEAGRWVAGGLFLLSLGLLPVDSSAQKSIKVIIGYSAVDASYLPLKIAEEAKLFEKYGIDAKISLVSGGSLMMKALLAGEVGAAFIGGTPVILARSAGGDTKIFLSLSNVLVYQVVAGPHLHGKVSKIEDLRGKRVSISGRGAESESVMRLVLQKHKVNPREVTFLQIGASGERLTALNSGAADVTALPSPQHLRAIKAGFPVITDVTKEQIEWLHTVVAMQESWVRREPQGAEALVKAFVEATLYGWANKAFTKRVLAKYIKSEDDEVLEQGYRDFLEYQAKDFRPTEAAIQATIDEMAEVNPKVKELKPEEIADQSILNQLDRSGFMAEMRKRHRR